MADTKTAVSVIIPAYNVEKQIACAVKSLKAQTLADFECIIVNDGSTDGTEAAAREAIGADKRFSLLTQSNMGAPAARNRGIRLASGEYLFFFDGDDSAEPEAISEMYAAAKGGGLDLLIAGFFIDTYDGGKLCKTQTILPKSKMYKSAEDFRRDTPELFDTNLLYTPWNKLYRREFLVKNAILFPDTYWDDFPFNLSVIRSASRFGTLEKAFYHFNRARGESETAKWRADIYQKREEEHGWLTDLYSEWGMNDEKTTEFLSRRYVERFVGCIENEMEKANPKSLAEKRSAVLQMLANPRLAPALKAAKPRSAMMKLMLLPLRLRSVFLCCAEGSFIAAVKRGKGGLFARLKAAR
ncbi:MAG: glycosyltransferase family 2 protein [Eubacteriales bacterium]|nr:glycosyltransferase family 2 protein [Eubacteriales bacterium]MDD3882664.1 glycosyltransferase family 2 protein [Eubacteriales bacterium]MDD4512764.1 glycosyltransferase family 2 protein [Eubacteriales bacterium]